VLEKPVNRFSAPLIASVCSIALKTDLTLVCLFEMQHYDDGLHGAQRTTPHCDLWRLEFANGTRFVAVRGQATPSPKS